MTDRPHIVLTIIPPGTGIKAAQWVHSRHHTEQEARAKVVHMNKRSKGEFWGYLYEYRFDNGSIAQVIDETGADEVGGTPV